jgi:hypothetical protein
VVPWAISTLMPHYGWEGGSPGFLNRLGLIMVILGEREIPGVRQRS